MFRHHVVLLGLLGATLGGLAHAKKATIRWRPFKLATKYHVQVLKADSVVVDETLDRNASNWSGSLEPGLYTYRIRVYDKVDRAGKWSDAFPLVVKPDPPKPQIANRAPVYPDPENGVVLEWEPIPGIDEYRVVVSRSRRIVADRKVRGPRAAIGNLPEGNYSWQVQALLKSKGEREPASLRGVTAEGELSPRRSFHVQPYLRVPTATLSLFSATGPFDYRQRSANSAKVSALGMSNGLDFEYWIGDLWMLDLTLESHFVMVQGKTIHLDDWRIGLQHSLLRPTVSSRWDVRVGLGPHIRQLYSIALSSGTFHGFNKFYLAGVDTSLYVGYLFSPGFRLGLGVNHQTILGPIDDRDITVTGERFLGNVSAQLTAVLRLSNRWDLALGVLGERIGTQIDRRDAGTEQIEQFQARGYASISLKFD